MMKRLLLILMLFLPLACVESEGPAGSAGNPLDECMCPASVRAGEEGIIQWNGFAEGAELCLCSDDGEEYALLVKAVTSSGLIFHVPHDVPPGLYKLVLLSAGRTELSEMEVLEPLSPVTGLSVPSQVVCGEEVSVSGLGFEEGCGILLVGDSGEEYALIIEITYDGVEVAIPEDMPEGEYGMYLLQDGVRWLLSDSVEVCRNLVIKRLSELRLYTPYIGTSYLMTEWKMSPSEPYTLNVSEYLVEEGAEPQLNAYDSYRQNSDGVFELVHDGLENSNINSAFYECGADGNVSAADVVFFGKKNPTEVLWSYDESGFVTAIASSSMTYRAFEYEGGNLTLFRQTIFEYGDETLVNHPCAADVAWGYMSLQEKYDPYVYIPYLLGWYDKASVLLPTMMRLPDPQGIGTVDCTLKYEFDADGYVTKMSWSEGISSCRVEYIYTE